VQKSAQVSKKVSFHVLTRCIMALNARLACALTRCGSVRSVECAALSCLHVCVLHSLQALHNQNQALSFPF
jgi:hypothetical protein